MKKSAEHMRGSAGFTLVEVLVSLAILAIIGVGVSAISLSGVIAIKDSTAERQDVAVATRLATMVFARDVQGAAGVVDECADSAGSSHLVTLGQSAAGDAPVEYRYSHKPPYGLLRVKCAATPVEDTGASSVGDMATQTLMGDMSQAPGVTCDDEECLPGTQPREIVLSVAADGSERFELLGTRRSDVPEPPSTTTTTTTTPPPVPNKAMFLALGGNLPLQVSGSPAISVAGDALFNRGSSGDVSISMSGNPHIDVSGVFGLQAPGTCTGCDKFANKAPTGFAEAIKDPLGSLRAPDAAGMPIHKSCRTEGRKAVCSPGVYEGVFPSASGGVGVYTLEPGVYVLTQGLSMSWGSISGDGVMLYTANGAMSIAGSSKITLRPPVDGPYRGVSVFQERTGNGSLAITGNALLSTPGGAVYGATQHLAMSGSARIEATQVITRSAAMSGNTRVVVSGG